MMKFGFDIHGVIDRHPTLYQSMMTALVSCGHEVHIITGIKHDIVRPTLIKLGFIEGEQYTAFFSIHEQAEQQGIHITIDDDNRPHFDPQFWLTAKANYCHDNGINLHIDDSCEYGQHFDESKTLYLQQPNADREVYNRDGK